LDTWQKRFNIASKNRLNVAKKPHFMIDAGRVGRYAAKTIASSFKAAAAKLLLAVLHSLQFCGRVLQSGWLLLKPVRRPVGRFFMRFIVLPIYKTFVFTQLRITGALASARGFFFLLFTHKYTLHTVLIIISAFTIGLQVQASDASAADPGQGSILYALVGQGQDTVVQEEVDARAPAKNVSYLGLDTIQAVPDIDFDYEPDAVADITVPGSIAEQPGADVIAGTTETPDATTPDVVVQRTKVETYTVQPGDLVGTIARRFGVNVGTIITANHLSKSASIKPGDTLKIPPVSGIMHTVKKGDTIGKLAKLYQADVDKITTANQLEDRALTVGDEIVIPDGVPVQVAVAPPKSGSNVRPQTPKTNIPGKSYDKYEELIDTRSDSRSKPADAEVEKAPVTKLLWPTTQHVITQYYGWRHTGIDLDGDYTDAIYAAADGVVETAGWNSSGYGLQIVIDHENGYKTRYGHSSKMFVKVGDRVKKGQTIAMVGTTGRSTGTHLHFEVYSNGKRQNPLAYIK
jgi:murein DD-endopeptidase MepM/ murein hydrolase activator NlpD